MMTKIELIKNYTIDELASMVLRKDEEIRQIDYALKKYLGIKHTDVDTQDEFEKLLQKQMAKEVADEAMKSIEINGITLKEFCNNLNSLDDNECHLCSCRYNKNCICQNEKKRKECIDVSMLVLCL